MPGSEDGSAAPSYSVPGTPVVSLEYPCIVENTEKAIDMLGGRKEVAQILLPNNEKPLGLKFRPHDPAGRTVIPHNKQTNNLLLSITVPKRTGRKRKRGSGEPFQESPADRHSRKDVAYLLRSLNDNPQRYQTEVVGSIQSTHVWRTMPDLVYSSMGSSFLSEIQTKVLPQQYPLLKQWSLPRTYGLANTETVPPPVLSTQSLPINYTYRQNPAVKTVADPQSGKQVLFNLAAPAKLLTYQCQYNDAEWPDQPPPNCPPISERPQSHQQLFQTMVKLFDERPVWTRRALLNQFPDDAPCAAARHLIAYMAFAIRSGPWRDTLCKYGVDPRKDRSYRKYQTVMLLLAKSAKAKPHLREDFERSWARSKDKSSHIFTGKPPFPRDGQVWQLCDLEDPQLKPLVDTPDITLRPECEIRQLGWYHSGTIAKIRVALKAKTDALISNEKIDEEALARFLTLPDRLDFSEVAQADEGADQSQVAYLPKDAAQQEKEWAIAYRTLCRTIAASLSKAGGAQANSKGAQVLGSSVAPMGYGLEEDESDEDAEEDNE
ncbi:RNA polymerase III transcription factor IIIC subunit-domain-containing protein [Exophiala viscosa]|uniref:RNA polymerase III transcription factor IIIC subunit-domain-containing protein n=1 Tax=Exophiala viscosa TaxID=2486360 RepID=A0AAN6IF63_9EURO|nr:RNA polymerase III transcription factor IIIC subunit-domain-containing protein [Exophiala viscosa]